MKRSIKLTLSIGALLLGAIVVSGCTANFCTVEEKARMLYRIDPGVFRYSETLPEEKDVYYSEAIPHGEKTFYRYAPADPKLTKKDKDGKEIKSPKYPSKIVEIRKAILENTGVLPSFSYYNWLDLEVKNRALKKYFDDEKKHGNNVPEFINASLEDIQKALDKYGYLKFYSKNDKEKEDLFGNFIQIHNALAEEHGLEALASPEYIKNYTRLMTSYIQNYRSCIATRDGDFGAYGDESKTVAISKKDWGSAWKKGPIEGLFVYPVAWLVDSIAIGFGGVESPHGIAQLGSLLIVTLIVRLFLFACTFKTTIAQQKMQALQPELAKIQMKYPNSNTNTSEKQRLAQEQMALYKRNKINPFSQLLVMLIQFPVFIGVWGAMTSSATLSTGALLGLQLSSSISTTLFNVKSLPSNDTGWWTALVLFILMGVAQFISMKLPQWIQKAKTKNVARLTKNPAADKQQNTMKWVSWFMLIMIIVMGFTLLAAMGIYWLFGAIISMIQTAIVQAIKPRSDKNKKKKVKTVKARRK